jgi:hypothetical protein
MKSDWTEQRLRELFLEQRRHDEPLAPPFARPWGAAAARATSAGTTSARGGRVAVLVTAVLLLTVGAAWWGYLTRRVPAPGTVAGLSQSLSDSRASDFPWESDVLLFTWRSPTDFLLNPSRDWLGTTFVPRGGFGQDDQALPPAHQN